jgi:uncharacterized protein YdaU (DUF1376 family)
MPLYVGDYLGDTGHLTTTHHGAYLLLMMHYWRKGELPGDDRQLCKIAKLPLKTWNEYRATLQEFFHDGWKHKRIDAELERMMRVSAKRAIAGQKGGIGSALARMKLENASLSRHASSRAIAGPLSSAAAASADHSHSHKSLLKRETGAADPLTSQPAERAEKSASPSAPSLRPMSPSERPDQRSNLHQSAELSGHGTSQTQQAAQSCKSS